MKVLYIWQAAYPWDVRTEKFCLALSSFGYEVEIIARRAEGQEKQSTDKGLSIFRVGFFKKCKILRTLSVPFPGNLLWWIAIYRQAKKRKPKFIVVRDIPLSLVAKGIARLMHIPWYIDMAEHYPEAMRTWKKYQSNVLGRLVTQNLRIPDWIEELSVKSCNGVFPVCEEMKTRLVCQYGISSSNVLPILNTPEAMRIPNEMHPQRGFCFGYHGVILKDRDLETVIKGFDLAASLNPAITLKIAGDGESKKEIEELITSCKNKDRISMSGRFKHAELAILYNEVDYGIVCWEVNEFTHNTIANKFFDYAAFGKPIIFTETRAMLSLMSKMNFGVSYRGGDVQACAQAFEKIAKANYLELAKNGHNAIQTEFNWENDKKKLYQFLSEKKLTP